jgi:hypothetical protein
MQYVLSTRTKNLLTYMGVVLSVNNVLAAPIP